jgi:hypothetical protein
MASLPQLLHRSMGRIDGFIVESGTMWMPFKVGGSQGGKLYGLPLTGKRVDVPEINVMRLVGSKEEQ